MTVLGIDSDFAISRFNTSIYYMLVPECKMHVYVCCFDILSALMQFFVLTVCIVMCVLGHLPSVLARKALK